jgi:hypothetical protein
MVKVTLDFEVREGFTMSPDGSSWSVIKGLSRAKITQLKKKQFFPDVIIAKYDLELAAGVAKFVEYLLEQSNYSMRDSRAPALGFLSNCSPL